MKTSKLLSVAVSALVFAPTTASAAKMIETSAPSRASALFSMNNVAALNDLSPSHLAGKKAVFEGPSGPMSMPIILVPLAAVPEPAAWGLLIAGFGFAGVVLRGRRSATVRYA
jgi:hypothetical protein